MTSRSPASLCRGGRHLGRPGAESEQSLKVKMRIWSQTQRRLRAGHRRARRRAVTAKGASGATGNGSSPVMAQTTTERAKMDNLNMRMGPTAREKPTRTRRRTSALRHPRSRNRRRSSLLRPCHPPNRASRLASSSAFVRASPPPPLQSSTATSSAHACPGTRPWCGASACGRRRG